MTTDTTITADQHANRGRTDGSARVPTPITDGRDRRPLEERLDARDQPTSVGSHGGDVRSEDRARRATFGAPGGADRPGAVPVVEPCRTAKPNELEGAPG